MTVKWSFRTGVFSLGMMAVRFSPLHFEAVILLDVRGGHYFFDTVKPAKTKAMVVMKDPVNLKSSVEHVAFAKGATRSQISQLSTRKKGRVGEAAAEGSHC
ncbi:hypothetical protein NC653_009438 [Populus alba x Populus x berolinensis]|uniref:Uncharacterized protein n=1 Tax=Populus alba x Populus x berolinensis TaxID=444605 RepID=A0AAD6W9R4_9ROSI|nr:hypothetical protein NC653_009438 [Populus alba x Populus x berolinensis]